MASRNSNLHKAKERSVIPPALCRHIVDSILPIIQQRIEDYNIKTYIEPFCDGCNIIDKVICDIKIASDKQKYLIEFLKNAEKIKDFPDKISREHYSNVRNCFNNKADIYI